MNKKAPRGQKATIHLSDTHQMMGYVRDGYFHVHDVIHNGVRESSFADRPQYHPIALSKIALKGHRIEYLD